ncbi:lamin tail domain-containing protein [Haloarcula nitratireducens]|uniref:Lamin tail domain-containing protein n=1 Tax=Haloarcula nitratireducens TaxID=2487749 RepID=A0AAW4PJ62_9EURY|nr:lamin tail domain-containing protein [Halomicroarcula nitratireducens]MBX0297994.1 lamin tail domain-containing protein [Halomicroarcula nitratireducens]
MSHMTDQQPWTTRTTTDHDEIREWVEARGATPTHVTATASEGDLGVLRIDFPEADVNLEPVEWDDFFAKFDREELAFRYQDEKRDGEQSYFHRFVSRDAMPGRTMTTTGHDRIREWAEARDAKPSHVIDTGAGDDVGVLRLDFPEEELDPSLEEIAWEDFFTKFDQEGLAFRYQETKASGEQSYFHRFVQREELGVTDAVDADVSVVAAGTAPTGTAPETDLTVGLVVDEIHEDARGYDHWNKNDEYLVFRNEGEEILDLTGWTVQSEDGHTYQFPEEFHLGSRKAVTLYTGSGDDSDDRLYWGAKRAVWKNTGDKVTVSDDEERAIIREAY